MTVSSTGTFALAAQSGLRGAEIWVDDVNSRGGIPIGGTKRKVELVKLDDRSDKTVVPKVYETLIKDEKVDLCFGPFGSTLTAAAVNATETNNKFMVIWSASANSIYQQGYKYVVSATQQAGTLLGKPGVKFFNTLGVKKIAFAYLDEPFPAALTNGAIEEAKKLGMEVTMNEKFAKGTKDFNILIQKAKASGADVFMPTAYEGDQMTIARQLREMNVDFKGVYFVYASQPQFLAIGKDALYHFSQTLLNDRINWKVTRRLQPRADDGALRQALPQRAVSRRLPDGAGLRRGRGAGADPPGSPVARCRQAQGGRAQAQQQDRHRHRAVRDR